MIKLMIVVSALAAVSAGKFEYMNDLYEYEDTPYQIMPLPYSNMEREKSFYSMRKKALKNAVVHNIHDEIKHPSFLAEKEEIATSIGTLKKLILTKITYYGAIFIANMKSAFMTVKVPAIIIGGIVTIAFCKITSICSGINSIKSVKETLKDLSLFITTEKLNFAAEFVAEAVRRYGLLQEELYKK